MRFDVDISQLQDYKHLDRPFYFGAKARNFSYVQIYIDFSLPFVLGFTPDIEHINWVKRAWGLMPDVKPLKAEPDDWVDLIPF